MRTSILLIGLGAGVLNALTGCGTPPSISPAWEFPAECDVLPRAGKSATSITVALRDPVDPNHAPWPQNPGERLLFGHLYETLITVDCVGDVRPGLAAWWRNSEGGRRWTFELREDARFWDGKPVTAHDVEWWWRSAAKENLLVVAGIDSLVVVGDRTMDVYFAHRQKHIPRYFAAASFSVAAPDFDSNWPLGSGPYRVDHGHQALASPAGRAVTLRPVSGREDPVIRFIEAASADGRDLLDGAIDIMVTDDPEVIDYARGGARLTAVGLPWDRTYVLLSTSRAAAFRHGDTPGDLSTEFTNDLARDAVRAEARGSRPPYWWEHLEDCGPSPGGVSWLSDLPGGARRVLYERDDAVARDLAERIVALAAADPAVSPEALELAAAVPGASGTAPAITAEGVSAGEFEMSLRKGDDFAYVLALSRAPIDPCAEARSLTGRAYWSAPIGEKMAEVAIPLVDTRLHVIADTSRVGLAVDGLGRIIITNGIPEKKVLP